MADYLSRMDFIILDELGYLPFAQSGGQLTGSATRPRSSSPRTSPSVNGRAAGSMSSEISVEIRHAGSLSLPRHELQCLGHVFAELVKGKLRQAAHSAHKPPKKEYNMPEFSDEERKRQGLKPCVHCGHFSRGTATVSQTGMSRTTEVSAWPSNRR